jgi:anaerobic selenocysteine-containing dehydrogenase
MKVTRRDLLVWSAGAAAGLMVTPVPWKVLDDVSIWSQNWPWIPQPARGPVEVKQSCCTLCPKGCGLRVRIAAGWPVGVAGVKTHPISRGALCPLGFGAHQLNWHPQRLRSVRHHGSIASWSEAQSAFAKAAGKGPIAIIDGYPGRAASSVFQEFVQKKGGSYLVVLGQEAQSLTPYEAWSGVPAGSLGYDLENAQTIVSFGAPLLDGWGTPGRFTRLWAERAAGMNDPQLRLIQVDSSLSRTAARAWQWISVREGSESTLAAGLDRVLLEQKLVPVRGPIPSITLSESALQTGLSVDEISTLARVIVARPPTLVIARDGNPAVAALNVVLGAVGNPGGIVRNSKHGHYSVSAETGFADARAVLIDSTVPWDFAPSTNAEIFRFAAWDAGPGKADWLLPAPGFLEELTDVPTPPAYSVATYALAPSLTKANFDTRSGAQFLANIDASSATPEQIIHTRCNNLWRDRKGTLYGQETTPLTSVASAQELEKQLWKGAVWVGEPASAGVPCTLKEWPTPVTAPGIEDWAHRWSAPVLPPLASKLYIESNLREKPEGRNA